MLSPGVQLQPGQDPKTLRFAYPIQNRINNGVGFGSNSIIEPLPCGTKVRKSVWPQSVGYDRDSMLRTLDREFEIYERLPQGHPRLVRMYGYHPDKEHDDRGIVLEYLRNGDLRKYFESGADITPEQRFQWALDAADAVRLLHSHEIIHSDIKTSNFLLDDGLRLRIADLSGSIDGKEPRAYETTRFYLPRDLYVPNPSSVRTDLFALGSSLYEIFTGKPPYADIQDDEVDKRYKDGIFPATDDVVCGDIIRGCWIGSIVSADAVHAAVKKQADAHTC